MDTKVSVLKVVLLALIPFTLSCQDKGKELIARGAELHLEAEGYKFTEGPAVDKDGNVFFTDQPNNRILKWSANDGKSINSSYRFPPK